MPPHTPRAPRFRTDLPQERQAHALYLKALAALQANKEGDAVKALMEALKLDPLHIGAMETQAHIFARYNKLDTAIELMRSAIHQDPDNPERYHTLAQWLSKRGDNREAVAAMHRCAAISTQPNTAYRFLGALYVTMGYEAQSQYWAKKAVRGQAFQRRDAKKDTKLTVLGLFTQASGSLGVNRNTFNIQTSEGHNNLAGLLDSDHITLIRFHVDTLDQQPELLRKLPKADVIYNSITDPERCEHALHLAQKVCDRLNLPVINEPNAVLAASREGNYARFKDNPDVILPKSVKVENTQAAARAIVEQAMQEHGFELPVIIRLAGYQGGKFMHKVDDLDSHDFTELDEKLSKEPQTAYVIQYHEVGFADPRLPSHTLYPKYRAFYIDGQLYPTHCLIGVDNYNVHMANYRANLEQYPWLSEFYTAYVEQPASQFPDGSWEALREGMKTLGLDYVGVDFAVIPSGPQAGKLLIFEANAAMRNFIEVIEEGTSDYAASSAAVVGAATMFCRLAAIDPWEFMLPRGKAPTSVIPADIECLPKSPLPDHAASNHRWLAERLGESNDFSDSPFFNTRHYIDEELLEHTARQQNIRVQRYPGRMLEFTQGQQQVVFHINAPRIPMDVMRFDYDKLLCKHLFKQHDIPTPDGEAFTEFEPAYRYFASRTRPQVVKPTNGVASRGVSVHITTPEQFQSAWKKARQIGQTVLVEDMIQGEELRVYFIGGEFVAATARMAAFVIGDGQRTIAELIEVKNTERARNPATAKGLIHDTPALERIGRSRNNVPDAGEWVVLGDAHMATQGGEYIALGDALPASLIAVCQNAASLLPSRVCGVDLFIEDLSDPQHYWITEVNASTPAIGGQFHFPRYGQPTAVAPRLLAHAFTHLSLPTLPGRITLAPSKPCKAVAKPSEYFTTDRLQMLACVLNLPVQRPAEDTLLIGSPPQLGWTQRLSTRTPMESVQVLKHKEWLGERLAQAGIAKQAPASGTDVRLLLAGERLLAAHAHVGEGWKDITETLHSGVVLIAAKIMHALYRPGHALVTLTMTHPSHNPDTSAWGIQSISLQPDLAMFYTAIDQPRDVIADLFATLLPGVSSHATSPVTQQLHISGKVQGVGYRQWLKREAVLHVLKAQIRNLPGGSVEAIVHGQPNAIAALVARCHIGPAAADVSAVAVNDWQGSVPNGVDITHTPTLV
ncbi:MAG: acylphosphatase [Halomonas sp.]|nr:acylphosphatase [Halomonas sp.]MDP3536557.1 acylphosphatase [Halomonas sp.]